MSETVIIPFESTATAQTEAERIAGELLNELNFQLQARVSEHTHLYGVFWRSQASPDDILAAMGNRAAVWLQAAAESAAHIERVAAIVGKQVGDYLPDEYRIPIRNFVPHPDGTVTLEP